MIRKLGFNFLCRFVCVVIYDVLFDLSGVEIGIEVSIDVEEIDEYIDGYFLVRIKLIILDVFVSFVFRGLFYFEVVSSSGGSSVIMVFGLNNL